MDIATMIVDLLRKKEENKALSNGGLTAGTPQLAAHERFGAQMTPEEAQAALGQQATPMQPDPSMMGGGIATKGGEMLKDRKAQLAAALAAAGG